MRNPAALGRTDANQAEIVAAYEALYCKVQDLHKVGGGCPDLLVRVTTKRGFYLCLVEVKTDEGSLSKSQLRWIGEWGASCVTVVQSKADVFSHVDRVRAGA